jgi:hypothetical protein
VDTVAPAEKVEGELDHLITRRHDRRASEEGERAAEEMWAASVRRYNEQQRQQHRAAWCEYHREAAERARRTLEALIREHEAAVAKLEMLEAGELEETA